MANKQKICAHEFAVVANTKYSEKRDVFVRDVECPDCKDFFNENMVFFALIDSDGKVIQNKNKCPRCQRSLDLDDQSEFLDDGDEEMACILVCKPCKQKFDAIYKLDIHN